jgi:predicted Zn finger-like uncharacterized protein
VFERRETISAMQTTCPSCHAVFRVTTVQLEAHAGKVRCGKCAYVFNAFETLVTPIETVSLMAPMEDDEDYEEELTETPEATEHAEAYDVRPVTIFESVPPAFPLPTDEQIDRAAEEINREIAASTHPDLIEEVEHNPKAGLKITPELHEKLNHLQLQLSTQEKHARWHVLAWGAGIVVLLLALTAQSIYFLRNPIAAYYPDAKPLLTTLCQALHCKVTLLANPDLIKLDATELQTVPDHPHVVTLNATLRNLAPYRQAYPKLELTLTDSANQPLARRQFLPNEYLPPRTKPDSGMPAQEELPIKLTLELLNLDAVGYKLLVYYP